MAHVNDEVVFALAAGTASDGAAESHVRDCVHCRQRVERARALAQAVSAAPRTAEPPADWWPSIRARIEAPQLSGVAGGARGRGMVDAGAWRTVPWRLAAGFVLAALLSAALIIGALRRRSESTPNMAGPIDVRPVPRAAITVPVSNGPADAANDAEVERQLLAELELRKGELRPATVAQIEANLRTIDRAIADVRSELARDPDNPALRQLLADSYTQKTDLLKAVANAS